MPDLRIIHTYGLIHDRRHILKLTLLEKQCKAKQAIQTGSGPRQPIQPTLNIPALQTVSDGTRPRHKPSQRDNQKVGISCKSFCSLTLQSQSVCKPSSFQSTPFLAWLCCIPSMPKTERQEAVGPKLMEGEKPLRRGYLSCLYIPIEGRFMPQEGQMKQAVFLWEPAISGEMSMSCLKLHRISDLTLHECEIYICLASLLFLSSRSERTSFCCLCPQHTSCDTRCYTWD